MKVLSLIEPYASLIKAGVKKIETRSWSTNYRGELYIHASMTHMNKANSGLLDLLDDKNLGYGNILCKCKLVDCIYMDEEFINHVKNTNPTEYMCGGYSIGRYAWILEDIEILNNPILVKGHLGIWNYEREMIKEKLKTLVKPGRYKHCLLVASFAEKLAKIYGLDSEKCYLAGLAHDIAKNFSYEENKFWVEKYGLSLSLLDDNYSKMVHADVGALVVKEWFNFDDDMYAAVKYHTIGNRKMTTFEKIIFIADKVGRVDLNSDLKEVKELATKDLDLAILLFLEKQEIILKNIGRGLHPETVQLINNLKNGIVVYEKR